MRIGRDKKSPFSPCMYQSKRGFVTQDEIQVANMLSSSKMARKKAAENHRFLSTRIRMLKEEEQKVIKYINLDP